MLAKSAKMAYFLDPLSVVRVFLLYSPCQAGPKRREDKNLVANIASIYRAVNDLFSFLDGYPRQKAPGFQTAKNSVASLQPKRYVARAAILNGSEQDAVSLAVNWADGCRPLTY